jgi:hypothetical protein
MKKNNRTEGLGRKKEEKIRVASKGCRDAEHKDSWRF